MTNLGFHALMKAHGIRVITTDVGDRYVLEALAGAGGLLGGEQSGHVIYLGGHVTGDGLAAAMLLCAALRGRRLSEAAAELTRYEQRKENVTVASKHLTPAIVAEVERYNRELGEHGRVLVRPSGTEPMVRVLVEAENGQLAAQPVLPSWRSFRVSSADRFRRKRPECGRYRQPGSRAFRPLIATTQPGRSRLRHSRRSFQHVWDVGYVGNRASKDLLIQGWSGWSSAATTRRASRSSRTTRSEYVRAVGNLQNLKNAAGANGSSATTGLGHHALGDARRR
jgi:hypothetical protein